MLKIHPHNSRLVRRAVFLFGLGCLCIVNGYAQRTVPGPRGTGANSFTTLLAKLQGGDTSIDFKALRMASLSSKAEAAGEADLASRRKTIAAFKAGNHDEVIAAGEHVLRTAYLDLETHLMVADAYRQQGDEKKFEFHRSVYLGLLQSIMAGADGRSAKTAYVVIGPYEEYAVMRALELSLPDRSFRRNEAGRAYDVLTGADLKTKLPREVWFNVDKVPKADQ